MCNLQWSLYFQWNSNILTHNMAIEIIFVTNHSFVVNLCPLMTQQLETTLQTAVLSHYTWDTLLEVLCCHWTIDPMYCQDLYRTVRPTRDVSYYTPPKSSRFWLHYQVTTHTVRWWQYSKTRSSGDTLISQRKCPHITDAPSSQIFFNMGKI